MDCSATRPNLLAYLDGEVTDARRAGIEAHLATCQVCADELARLRALQADLREVIPAGLAHLRLPHPAEDRIRARLRRAQARPSLRGVLAGLLRPRPRLVKAAIPLVVAFFLAFAGFIGTLGPQPVSAQETIVLGPATLAPDTDAALRVIVRDHTSARPVSDARIAVRLRVQGEDEAVLLYTGRTGRQGTADVRFHVPPYAQDYLSASLIVHTTSSLGQDEVSKPVSIRRSFRVYLTSDKPLYQPGQPIHLRVLALEATTRLPAADRRVTFIVERPDGERVFKETLRASGYGIASTDYTLPADAPHGAYRLSAALGDTASERTVTVGRYERPRFVVDLALVHRYYLPGEIVGGQVGALSFNRDPLAGAAVTLNAYLGDPDPWLVATVQGRTDEWGAFVFAFGLPADLGAETANLALEASVADETGHVEWAGRVLPVAAEPLAVSAVAEGGRLRPGIENAVYILTATPDGAPVSAQLTLDLDGQPHELATDAFGLAEFRFVPQPGLREVPLRVVARDAQGREVTRDVTLSADRGPAQVLLRLDRAAYEVGDTMHLEAFAGQGEVVYLDVVRQGQTLSTHLAELRDGRAELALDVSPDMAGTLQVHAYQVLPGGTVTRDARLAVVDAPAQVSVDIRADKQVYQPGDVAQVAVDTRLANDGPPVQSAVGVAVVDESVFALEDRAPGFAKLFFLLEASQFDAAYRTLSDLTIFEGEGSSSVSEAQDRAARAAWVDVPVGELPVQRSAPSVRMLSEARQAEARAHLRGLVLGLSGTLLILPLGLWAVVVGRLRRAGSLRPALGRTALVLIGLTFVCVMPLTVAALLGVVLLLGETVGKVLLVILLLAWLAALVALGVHAWRRRDDGAQIVVLLAAAYGVLGALLGYVAEQGGDLSLALSLGIALAFLAALAALLLLAAGLWREERRGAAGATVALVVLFVAVVVLAGAVLPTSSLFAQTMTDPRLYAGPVGWLSGCATATPELSAEHRVETKVVYETVVVEKEVTKIVAGTPVVATEVVKEEVEVVVTATPVAEPTQPAATASPAPTATPPPQPTAVATVAPTEPSTPTPVPTATPPLPPPLLGQFVPETIYWAPQAITDENGHLEIQVALPDAPTAWRLTALASTLDGQLGTATAILYVTR